MILVLLALGSAVAIPAWFGRSSVTLDQAAKILARDLRNAQNRAAFERRPTEVRFDEAGTGYLLVDQRGDPLVAPLGGGDYRREYPRDAVFRGVRIESAEFGDASLARYDARGVIQSGGTVVLSYSGDSRTLRVDSETGLIEIEGLSEPWVDSGL